MYLMIGNDEYYIECDYEYTPEQEGRWAKCGQIEPDEPSTLDITKIMVDFSEESGKRQMFEMTFPLQVIRDLELEILQELEA